MTSFVYFIHDAPSSAIKVGVSKRPLARLAQLRSASSTPLSLVGLVVGGVAQEREIHRLLNAHKVRGEWFEANEVVWCHVRALLAERGVEASAEVDQSTDPLTERARSWVMQLLHEAGGQKAYGDVAQQCGTTPGLIYNLQRKRLKAITARDYEAIRLAAVAMYDRRLDALMAEIALVSDLAAQGLDPVTAKARASALLAEAQGLHATMKAGGAA